MLADDTKKSLLEWLFGKSALDKAAQQGDPNAPPPPKPPNPWVKPKPKKDPNAPQPPTKNALDKLTNPFNYD